MIVNIDIQLFCKENV